MQCTKCELHQNGTQPVEGEGSCNNGLLIIGEAPGREESEQGRPFVGAAGKMLRSLLLTAGVDPSQCRITNTVKCRPPENRKPTKGERAACWSHLEDEVSKYCPASIITVGLTSSQAILQSKESMAELQAKAGKDGILCKIGSVEVRVYPVWHTSPLCINRVKLAKEEILQGILNAVSTDDRK